MAQLQTKPFLTESVLQLIKTQLQSNFNLELEQIDNQYSDGITLEPVDDNAIHFTDLIQTLSPPAIYIMPGQARFNYDEKRNYMQSEDEVIVVVSAEDIGADVLILKSMRYARVLFACLNLVDLFDSNNRIEIHIVPDRLGYTQPIAQKLNGAEQTYRMDCVLNLKVLHFEKNLN